MPGPEMTAPPTAVPKAMPTLNAVGSSELASVSACGYSSAAVVMNSEMHGVLTTYMVRAMPRMIARAQGMAGPTAQRPKSRTAWIGKLTSMVFTPKRASHQPLSRLEAKHMPPYAMSAPLASRVPMPRMFSR